MQDDHSRRGMRILIVEDHLESLELLQMVLEDEGYHVQSARTGRDALETISPKTADDPSTSTPDLILLDLRLPDMNGVDVVKELQNNLPVLPPVVFLSADPPHALKEAAHSVGATAVRKPFDFDELFHAINCALAKASLA